MESGPVRAVDPPLLATESESKASRRKKLRWIWILAVSVFWLYRELLLLGLLATLVVPSVLKQYATTSCVPKDVRDIAYIESALKEFAIANGGKFPDSLEALVTPDVHGRVYLDCRRVPKDPWGREYLYEPPGPGQPMPIVRSYGKDGQPGGEGDDADIDNLSPTVKRLVAQRLLKN